MGNCGLLISPWPLLQHVIAVLNSSDANGVMGTYTHYTGVGRRLKYFVGPYSEIHVEKSDVQVNCLSHFDIAVKRLNIISRGP